MSDLTAVLTILATYGLLILCRLLPRSADRQRFRGRGCRASRWSGSRLWRSGHSGAHHIPGFLHDVGASLGLNHRGAAALTPSAGRTRRSPAA